ncbi:BON domain-containing protein [Dechloromonas sp. HYN0024]|uniref:BON domain-containing protein n=1 Tax=Dechloromonas sp. HYN0024 TaxID=2231055 RepID=UPI0013C2AC2D|nr:BON domain-containing protein [Dechloromonas sp. HYN0024]
MQKAKLTLTAVALLTLLPILQGCVPAIIGGAAVGVMSAHDRRSTGTQADDETTEWKAGRHVPEQYKAASHVNFTSYNRRVLITGEVPSEEAKSVIEAETRKIEGVREVYNELGVGPASSLGSRSTDSYIDSKVKARLVDSNQISANHIKVITERAIVHLMGMVNAREAKVAIDVARTTAGVKKVVNVLEVIADEDARRLDNQMLGARTPPPATAPVESR